MQSAPVEEEPGWAVLRERVLNQERARKPARAPSFDWRGLVGEWSVAAPWLRWSVAAQFGLLLALGALALPREPAVRYHALGLSGAAKTGNIVVMFKPQTSEARLRELLEASGARIVDGPTSTDAFLLSVPAAQRRTALAKLRAASPVSLAEPIDAGGSP
jgi:hypothetical protein